MKFLKKIEAWFQARRDRKAAALPDGAIDIVNLYKSGFITARATGQTITDIRAEVTSRVNVPLKVVISHGTYFVSRGNHQNMVTRRKYEIALSPMEKREIRIPASCINASLPIPNENDHFNGVSRVSKSLCRFMEAAEGEDAMVIQAGVWTITDGYSKQQIQSTLRVRRSTYRDSDSHDTGSAISDQHVLRAKRILDDLGIRNSL